MNTCTAGKNSNKCHCLIKMRHIVRDVGCRHVKRVFKNFNNKNLGDYHDLYVQSGTLLLADVFKNLLKLMN